MAPTADNERVLIDVTIAAPRDAVWQALRDPRLIAQWFGWDYDALPGEIEFIFAQGPTAEEAGTFLQFGEWEGTSDRFELSTEGEATRLRVVRAAPAWADDWDKLYQETIEGWISFVEQLRFLLERHPGGSRRTLRLSGKADARHRLPTDALGIDGLRDAMNGSHFVAELPTGDRISGHVWHTARHQVGLEIDEWNDALLIVVDQPKSDGVPYGGGALTLTTFGLPEAAFAALEERLTAWWNKRYPA